MGQVGSDLGCSQLGLHCVGNVYWLWADVGGAKKCLMAACEAAKS